MKTAITGTVDPVLYLFSVMLNYLLVPIWGLYGAIIVFNITSLFTSILIIMLGMKSFPIPIEYKRLGITGTIFFILLIVVFYTSKTNHYIYYSIVPILASMIAFFCYKRFFYDQEILFIKDLFIKFQKRTHLFFFRSSMS
jgi:O-antigen/teichoic acid export membrane protein